MNGESSVREVDLETGAVRRKKMLANSDFAEGITRLGDKCGTGTCDLCSAMGSEQAVVQFMCNELLACYGFLKYHAATRVLTSPCRLYQVTWQSPKMFSYKVDNFEEVRTLTHLDLCSHSS